MADADLPAPTRRRRRAVGPPGAAPPGAEPCLDVDVDAERPVESEQQDDERLRREVPPHHGS